MAGHPTKEIEEKLCFNPVILIDETVSLGDFGLS
jgi:hypothetical protein